MEILYVFLLGCATLLHTCVVICAEESIKLTDSTDLYIQKDALNQEFSFKVVPLNLYDVVQIFHENPITSEKRSLGTMEKQVVKNETEGYSISFNESSQTFTVKIDKVRAVDDGTIIFVAKKSADKGELSARRNVTVIQSIKVLYLQFDGSAPISAKPKDPIEVVAGKYDVKCIAEGSNPATEEFKLHLSGKEVNLSKPENEQMEGSLRKFRSNASGEVTLVANSKGLEDELKCVARDTTGQSLSVKLGISVQPADLRPIKCEKVSAEEGQKSVALTCTVDHTGLNVSNYAFQIGDTGEIIVEGEDNKYNATVTTTEVSGTTSKVTLTLAKAEGWHFESDFYLLINSTDGRLTKETFKLSKTKISGSSIVTGFSFFSLAVVALLMFILPRQL